MTPGGRSVVEVFTSVRQIRIRAKEISARVDEALPEGDAFGKRLSLARWMEKTLCPKCGGLGTNQEADYFRAC